MFEIDLRIRIDGRGSMPENWIGQRYKSHQKRIADEEQKKTWQTNAQRTYPSMFERLQQRVEADVNENNRLFENKLKFHSDGDGFLVTDKNGLTAEVARALPGTVIQIERFVEGKKVADHIDVIPDDKGNIRYRHNGKILDDVSDASEIIIGKLIPEQF